MRDQALPIWEGHNAQDPTLMGFDLIEFLRIFGVPNAGSPILKGLVVKLVCPSSSMPCKPKKSWHLPHLSSPAVAKFPPGGSTQHAETVKGTFTPKRARYPWPINMFGSQLLQEQVVLNDSDYCANFSYMTLPEKLATTST